MKCDIDDCHWEGTQLAQHKSKMHGIHSKKYRKGTDYIFRKIVLNISMLNTQLSWLQITKIKELLENIAEAKKDKLRRYVEEEHLSYEAVMKHLK